MSHTPAPWSQSHREKSDGMWSTEVYDANGETIATMAWYPVEQANGWTGTRREANARLIAAAPELLAALKSLRNEVVGAIGIGLSDSIGHTNAQCLGDKCQAAFEAIQKAEGR